MKRIAIIRSKKVCFNNGVSITLGYRSYLLGIIADKDLIRLMFIFYHVCIHISDYSKNK